MKNTTGTTDMEKVDLGRLYYLYTIAFFSFVSFMFLFTLLFSDNVSLFSAVDNINLSKTDLNSDLSKLNAWVNQWKMTFSSDANKQAEEVIFSRKIKKT